MARIIVDPDALHEASRWTRAAGDTLRHLVRHLQSVFDHLDWEVRSRAGIAAEMATVRVRAAQLIQQAEDMARYLAHTARAFEEADRQGVLSILLPEVPRLDWFRPTPRLPWPFPRQPHLPLWPFWPSPERPPEGPDVYPPPDLPIPGWPPPDWPPPDWPSPERPDFYSPPHLPMPGWPPPDRPGPPIPGWLYPPPSGVRPLASGSELSGVFGDSSLGDWLHRIRQESNS